MPNDNAVVTSHYCELYFALVEKFPPPPFFLFQCKSGVQALAKNESRSSASYVAGYFLFMVSAFLSLPIHINNLVVRFVK